MFPHLHLHTWFSFGFGASSPGALAEAATERGIPALAATDTNTVAGAVEFQAACEAAGVSPILGAHLSHGGEEAVVLAEDEPGWGAACRAVTGVQWAERAGPFALAAQLATDRRGLCVLVRSPELLERLVRLSGPEGLWAEPRHARRRAPPRRAGGGHQRGGDGAPRGLVAAPAARGHRGEHDARRRGSRVEGQGSSDPTSLDP